MKTTVIIQSRMNSSRLPGKALMNINGKPLLEWVMDAVELCTQADEVVIATSVERSDDPIADFAKKKEWCCCRGPLDNVAQRFLDAAQSTQSDLVARICGDSPFMDHRVVDQAIHRFKTNDVDLVSNVVKRTFPAGVSVEVFKTRLLEKAVSQLADAQDKEHVTPWFYRNKLRVESIENETDLSHIRLTIDTADDFQAMSKVFEKLVKPKSEYSFTEIAELKRKVDSESSVSRI